MRAREYGKEFPERPLMGQLSDLLGIQHFTTSNGGTVRRDFLLSVGAAVGLDGAKMAQMRRKEDVVEAIIRRVNNGDFDPAVLSTEGNVTNDALEVIIRGVERSVSVERSIEHARDTGVGVSADPQPVSLEGELDADDVEDLRRSRLASIAVRDGQDRFRRALLEAYGSRCAITGTNAATVLEAAHIAPYRGVRSNIITNGLLLRADVHTLFDRGAIAIDENNLEILFARHLLSTTYAELAAARPMLREPRARGQRPRRDLLRAHRLWAGL